MSGEGPGSDRRRTDAVRLRVRRLELHGFLRLGAVLALDGHRALVGVLAFLWAEQNRQSCACR